MKNSTAAANPVPNPLSPKPNNADENSEEEQSQKRGRARGMNAQEKLVLIRECCEHVAEFKPGNKGAFWAMICQLLKENTGYDLKEPRNTVLRWVAKRVDELVEEEMGSGTQVDQDDFKVAVEQFNDRLKTVKKELDKQVKTKQAQTAELFEAARVQSAMVFGLDDELIPGVDATADSQHATTSGKSSIALNQVACATANK